MSFRTFEELAQDAVRLNNAPLPAFKTPDAGPTPSAGETITAAFRQDNTVASFLSSKTLGHDNYDDGAFMPSEYAKEVGMADQVDAFKGVMNRPLAEAIKQQLEMERKDKQTLEASGFPGSLMQFVAGFADLPTALPGGAIVKSATGGYAIVRSALSVGGAALAGATTQELALQATQQARTVDESLFNIGTATLMGSVLGGAVAGALSRPLLKSMEKPFADAVDIQMGVKPNELHAVPPFEQRSPAGLSAEAVLDPYAEFRSPTRLAEETAIAGTVPAAINRALSFFSPSARAAERFSPVARDLMPRTATDVTYRNMHFTGETLGPAVEARVAMEIASQEGLAKRAADEAFAAMTGDFRMSEKNFFEAIRGAMSRGDQHENPAVVKAAKAYRKLVDHFTQQGIDLGMYKPEDLTLNGTAAGYVPRFYNRAFLNANELQFKDMATKWYSKILDTEHLSDKARLDRRTARNAQEADDLAQTGPARAKRIDDLDQAAKDLDAKYAGIKDVIEVELPALYRDLRDNTKAMRDAKTTDERVALEKERARIKSDIAALKDAGGGYLKAYRQARAELRARKRNLTSDNPDAQAARAEKLDERTTNIADEVYRSLTAFAQRAKNLLNEAASGRVSKGAVDTVDTHALRVQRQIAKAQQDIDKLAAKETAAPTGFRTAKGSTYQVHADGTTTRNKAARTDPGHENDSGVKPKTERTVYADADAIELAAAGLQTGPKGVRIAIKGDRAVLLTWNDKAGKWGLSKASRAGIKLHDGPSVGRHPVELWKKADDVDGTEAYRGVHVGNAITEMTGGRVGVPATAEVQATLDRLKTHSAELDEVMDRLAKASDGPERVEALKASLKTVLKGITEAQAERVIRKGEFSQRLKDRAAKLTPDEVKARKAARDEELRASNDAAQKHYRDRWAELDTSSVDDMARQIADDIFQQVTGRVAQLADVPNLVTRITAGPLKARTVLMPDELLEPYLIKDMREVASRFSRSMAGEIELTRTHGRADMRDQMQAIANDYTRIRVAAQQATSIEELNTALGKNEFRKNYDLTKAKNKVARNLDKDEKGALQDMEAVRDILRGTYKMDEHLSTWGSITRLAMPFQYITKMGGAGLSSVGEFLRPAIVHGLQPYTEHLPELIKEIGGAGSVGIKMSIKEANLAGLVMERTLSAMRAGMSDVGDPLVSATTSAERAMNKMAHYGSKWNGLNLITDWQQAVASVMSQHRMIEAITSTSQRPDQAALLRLLGISKNTEADVARLLAQHGDTIDGVRLPNTEKWAENLAGADRIRAENAVRVFRAAMNTDVHSMISKAGIGDKPLFANTPTGRLIFQFSSFNMGAHRRVMMRGMQEDKVRFIAGTIAMTSIGMATAYAAAWRNGAERFDKFNRDIAHNPLILLAEGVDRSGVFPLFFDAANRAERVSSGLGADYRFNPIKSVLTAPGGKPPGGYTSTRVSDGMQVFGALGGPTVGMVDSAFAATRVGLDMSRGIAPKKADKNQAGSILPFNSFPGARETLQILYGNSPIFRP